MLRRDLPSLLSRPVTRLPRLKFQLEDALKHTAPDHPDIDAIPPILDVLNDLIKSTQPGIEVSEGKVHFWELCESLVYQQGEIIVRGSVVLAYARLIIDRTWTCMMRPAL